MSSDYFLKMIINLRQNEEILLYDNILEINASEASEVIHFLELAYNQESLEYPYTPPNFNAEAALWGAKTIYIAAQLILYRENKESDFAKLLPDFSKQIDSAAMLSCDLCLRFLPEMINQLKLLDYNDQFIPFLESKLLQWHYSAIQYPLETNEIDFLSIANDKCMLQLYINRIIKHKKISLANHPQLKHLVLGNLGNFAEDFWKDLKITNINHE